MWDIHFCRGLHKARRFVRPRAVVGSSIHPSIIPPRPFFPSLFLLPLFGVCVCVWVPTPSRSDPASAALFSLPVDHSSSVVQITCANVLAHSRSLIQLSLSFSIIITRGSLLSLGA